MQYDIFKVSFTGNIPLALDLTNKLLEMIPAHPRAVGNKVYYVEELHKANTVKKKGDDEYVQNIVTDEVIIY